MMQSIYWDILLTISRFLGEEGVVSVTGKQLDLFAWLSALTAVPLDFLPRKKTPAGTKKYNHPLQNWLVRRIEVRRCWGFNCDLTNTLRLL